MNITTPNTKAFLLSRTFAFSLLAFLLLFLINSCKTDTDLPEIPCQGKQTDYCNRPYNKVTFAGTHNAFAYAPIFHHLVANQRRTLTQQLEDGIRCLNLDVWLLVGDVYCADSAVYLYHSFPGFGCLFFTDALAEVKQFLDLHPQEVVTITIEDTNLNMAQLDACFTAAGLTNYRYHKTPNQTWNTISEMIDADKRLVVFANISNPTAIPGYFRNWNHIFDNPYSASHRDDFSCTLNRGNLNHDLFLLNHFITVINPRPDSAHVVNTHASLSNHINNCYNTYNRLPNFIYVDFYDVGDLLAVTDSLNRFGWQ